MPERDPAAIKVYSDFARTVSGERGANKNYATILRSLASLVVHNATALTSVDDEARRNTRQQVVDKALESITIPKSTSAPAQLLGIPGLVADYLGRLAVAKSDLPESDTDQAIQYLYNAGRQREQLAEFSPEFKKGIDEVNGILLAADNALSLLVRRLTPQESGLPRA